MYAVVARVSVDPAQRDNSQRMLREQVVPMVKQAPGFVAGYWTEDAAANKGFSLVLFETEQDARNQLARIQETSPDSPAPGVTWELRTVAEVIAEAKK